MSKAYSYYKLLITDFRRSNSQQNFANLAEFRIYDKDGRIPNISEMVPDVMPHIETEMGEVCISERFDGSKTIDNGNFITDREFEDMYNLALGIFRPMVHVNHDACLMHFNKEKLEII